MFGVELYGGGRLAVFGNGLSHRQAARPPVREPTKR